MAPHSIDHVVIPTKEETKNEQEPYSRIRAKSPTDAPVNKNRKVVATPKPGFCVKIFNIHNSKMFVNVCGLRQLPYPNFSLDTIMESMLLNQLEGLLIPMSISALRVINAGENIVALVCDVAINLEFLKQCNEKYALQMLIIVIFSEYVERVYKMRLNIMQAIILKRKFYGLIADQLVNDVAVVKLRAELYTLETNLSHVLGYFYKKAGIDAAHMELTFLITMQKNLNRALSYRIEVKTNSPISESKCFLLLLVDNKYQLDYLRDSDEFSSGDRGCVLANVNLKEAVGILYALSENIEDYVDGYADESLQSWDTFESEA